MALETTALHESGAVKGGKGLRRRAKLVAADTWGSTAYYPSEVLRRDGPRVFQPGTQMFENHLSESESLFRPEGDVRNLIGKLVSEAVFEPDNPEGPGLYADVEFYASYGDRINEIGEDIGLSIMADGLTEWGTAGDREGPVLAAILKADSVDVVTKAGAGGKLVSILESDRGPAGRPITEKEQPVAELTKEDLEAGFATLGAQITGLVDTLKESLAKPAETEVEKPKVEEEEPEKKEEVEIDHVALAEALRNEDLPAQSAGAVIADLKEGKTLAEAIESQTKLREAYVASVETGTVVLKESAGKADTGLARSITILG